MGATAFAAVDGAALAPYYDWQIVMYAVGADFSKICTGGRYTMAKLFSAS